GLNTKIVWTSHLQPSPHPSPQVIFVLMTLKKCSRTSGIHSSGVSLLPCAFFRPRHFGEGWGLRIFCPRGDVLEHPELSRWGLWRIMASHPIFSSPRLRWWDRTSFILTEAEQLFEASEKIGSAAVDIGLGLGLAPR